MNPNQMFQAAIETTRVIKRRRSMLFTFGSTRLPYYFVAQSEIDPRDTVVRSGKVTVEKPHIYIPGFNPQFEGFEFEEGVSFDEEDIKYVFLARRVMLPSLRYIHSEKNLTVETISVDEKIEKICTMLERKADTTSAVIRGRDKFFPFPLLIYVGEMILHSSGANIIEMLEKRRGIGP